MVVDQDAMQLKLMDGVYQPYEILHLLRGYVEENSNFYKSQYLINWERNHSLGTKELDENLVVVDRQKEYLQDLEKRAKRLGKRIRLKGTLEIELVK